MLSLFDVIFMQLHSPPPPPLTQSFPAVYPPRSAPLQPSSRRRWKPQIVCLAWELITEEETLQNENPKKKSLFPLGCLLCSFSPLMPVLAVTALQSGSGKHPVSRSGKCNEGQDNFLWSMADGEMGGSSSAWTWHWRADFEKITKC